MLLEAAGASVEAEGAGKAAAPTPPTSAFFGLGRLQAPVPHLQTESHTASTAPARWFLLESPGRGLA